MKHGRFRLTLCSALAFLSTAIAQDRTGSPASIDQLGLAELLAVQVSSASRKDEQLLHTAAAVDVLTGQEIRRAGAQTLPETLRYATGVQVARHTSQSHAISIRGFNLDASNKLEVLMDGRSLYTPFFSGVLWESPDYVLADLDRIEVVRGPGATLWGANAVNGVISIYTKGSEETQGALLHTTLGSPESFTQSARVGFKLDENVYARVYAKYVEANDTWFESGEKSEFDRWEMTRVGFRSDYLPREGSRLIVEGEIFTDKLGIVMDEFPAFDGGFLLARWEQEIDADLSYELQGYYDRYDRLYIGAFEENRQTSEASFQFRYSGWKGHDIVGGAGYRYSSDESRQVSIPYLEPASDAFGVADIFIQDEIALRDRLSLIVGGTLEHNSLIDRVEFQPTARVSWTASEDSVVWGAVSRAVRTPARADTDLRWITEGFEFYGSRNFMSEEALSLELGGRRRVGEDFSLDVSLFCAEYDNLPTTEPQGNNVYFYQNKQKGTTWGGEATLEYRPNYWSRFSLAYSHFQEAYRLAPDSQAAPEPSASNLGNDPENMMTIGALFELPNAVELSGYLRYVDELPSPAVPEYLALDLRLAWAPNPAYEFALVGRDLLDHRHPEYRAASAFRREVSRSVQVQATFNF